jgi:hypothetical protein
MIGCSTKFTVSGFAVDKIHVAFLAVGASAEHGIFLFAIV